MLGTSCHESPGATPPRFAAYARARLPHFVVHQRRAPCERRNQRAQPWAAYEDRLTACALELLGEIPGAHIVGPCDPTDRGSALSFTVDGIHPHDVGQVLDERGIAVRVGHRCARPGRGRAGGPGVLRGA
ncbi:aminotransferase class V-fold PLP-dependent enzyme [Streptomyces sp. NPDC059862]|uniref:aminotransferase class V-fold PLP-dependent enzyme n=1 Tax=unclassified Streptomyces TaxID=2593676 RepID=UPI0036390923